MRLLFRIPQFLLLIWIALGYAACSRGTLLQDKLKDDTVSLIAESNTAILNSLSPDSLFSLLTLPAYMPLIDSISMETQFKLYSTGLGECEEMVLVQFDLTASDSEYDYYVAFCLIRFKGKEWSISTPLVFDLSGGVDANMSVALSDDTSLHNACATIKIEERYEDEETSYEHQVFYVIEQNGEFKEVFRFTPYRSVSPKILIEDGSYVTKPDTVITQTLQTLTNTHDRFSDIKVLTEKRVEEVISTYSMIYVYHNNDKKYRELKD